MGGENLQKYFCRPLPSAAGPGYYYEIYVGGNNRARALVPGERYATLDQGSAKHHEALRRGTKDLARRKAENILLRK